MSEDIKWRKASDTPPKRKDVLLLLDIPELGVQTGWHTGCGDYDTHFMTCVPVIAWCEIPVFDMETDES